MRAMLSRLEDVVGHVEFTVLYQFRDRTIELDFPQKVTMLPIIMPPREAASLSLFGALKAIGLARPEVLIGGAKRVVEAYEEADLILSAPGGPYFGDLYVNHEFVHWFFVWLGSLYAKPLGLYAPSAGPFQKRWMNPVRRRLYKQFDVLCSREAISADFVRQLVGDVSVHVTADSALQVRVPPMSRETYFRDDRASLAKRFVVGVSAIDYGYPGASDPEALKKRYFDALVDLVAHVARQRESHFLLVPQLHGRFHSDVAFLKILGDALPPDVSWEIVDDGLSSDVQRQLFGMADMYIASRYHPGIFGASAGVPGVCIYYEHKALGFMQQLGLEDLAFDIRNLDPAALIRAADHVMDDLPRLRRHIEARLPDLMATAQRTTELMAQLLPGKTDRPHGPSTAPEPRP